MFISSCFPLKFLVFLTYAINRDTPLILSFLQQLCSCSDLCLTLLKHTQNSWPLCSLTPFSVLFVQQSLVFSSFPCSWNEVILYLQNWKIKQACKKYSSVVHCTKIFLCLFTLDVWVYAETNWLQKYRTDDQKCG